MNCIIKPVPFDYNTKIRFVEELIKEYPFINAEIIGRSALNRGVFSLSVGNQSNSVIFTAGFCGTDGLTCELLLLFVEKMCHAVKHSCLLCGVDIKRALTQLGITVVPCVNPDGIEIAQNGFECGKSMKEFLLSSGCEDHRKWSTNAFGVDINRNFSPQWNEHHKKENEQGIRGPSAKGYCGEFPESEAETKVLSRLCRLRHFRQCLSLHPGDGELHWQYNEKAPGQSSMMAKILADSCGYSLESKDNPSQPDGFKNWFIDEFSSPGFSLKIHSERCNSPYTKLYDVYEGIEEALTLFALM